MAAEPLDISSVKTFVEGFFAKPEFLKELEGDFMTHVQDLDKPGIYEDAISCIIVKPRGVGRLKTAGKYQNWIKNKTVWQPWCERLLAALLKEFPKEMEDFKKRSQFVISMGDFWPACAAKLDQQQELVKKAKKEQLDELEREQKLRGTK